MEPCLIALGSNLGDRAATLESAAAAVAAADGVTLLRRSRWHATKPVGLTGETGADREFLNGAALVETTLDPADLQTVLQRIERQHGRARHERWADRTLDLDMLLYGAQVIETRSLVVPHPRMSFRRFVLEPAAEIAGELVHPTIGWSLGQLLRHLDAGTDAVAILSPRDDQRGRLSAEVAGRCGGRLSEPAPWTTWVEIPQRVVSCGGGPATADDAPYAAASLAKLTILLDPPETWPDDAEWAAIVRQTVRGPTLRLPAASPHVVAEVLAAVEAVWPHLGPRGRERLQ